MKAKDAMTSPAITVTPETPLRDVGSVLSHHRISAVPVVDGTGQLLGLLSERDLITADVGASQESAGLPSRAGDGMNRSVRCVDEDTELDAVARLLVEPDARRVLVVRDREVLGVISRRDLVKWMARSDATLAGEVRSALHDQADRLSRLEVQVEGGVARITGLAAVDTLALAARLARAVPGIVQARADDTGV
jgi:CBS domain-containing protein